MTIIDVENMSAAEIKAKRTAIIGDLKSTSIDELAERFVDARYDAKVRDEKLASQGVTLTALQDGMAIAKGKIEQLERHYETTNAALTNSYEIIEVAKEEHREELAAAVKLRDDKLEAATANFNKSIEAMKVEYEEATSNAQKAIASLQAELQKQVGLKMAFRQGFINAEQLVNAIAQGVNNYVAARQVEKIDDMKASTE